MELSAIRARLSGREATLIRPERTVTAAVLVPLLERDGALHLLFEQRESSIPQGGEICFPGGHAEPGESPAQAARRETAEELLMPESKIELLAPLHILNGHVNREIHSYLGVLHGYAGGAAPAEVARVFTIPLQTLLDTPPKICTGALRLELGEGFPFEAIPGGRDYPFAPMERKFYFYPSPCGAIWGLTAELLFRFLDLLR